MMQSSTKKVGTCLLLRRKNNMKYFITSINQKLFEKYGENFLSGWAKFAANDCKLIVCFEGEISDLVMKWNSSNTRIINIKSEAHNKFINKYSRFNEAKGIQFFAVKGEPGKVSYRYNYRFDAIRFAFKIFSFVKCFELGIIDNDFAWLDADVVCLKKFESGEMSQFFPSGDEVASYLGRDSFPQPNPYSECGFVGYNFNNSLTMKFIERSIEMYDHGDLFELKEWHDCMVFDSVRKSFEANGAKFKNLSEHLIGEEHPFMKTGLSEYFDHLKGPERKKIGHS